MANIYSTLNPVESSMFSRAGYSDSTWELLFEFKSNKEIKAYKNVSPEVADEALAAKSLGAWWNQNIRGNPAWEFEVLGADPSVHVPVQTTAPLESSDMGISEADIQQVDPKYVATKITQVQSGKIVHDETGTHLKPFGLGDVFTGPVTVTAPKMMHITEVADWPKEGFPQSDEEAFQASDIATIPQAEIMPAWTAPENAFEALEMLSERESEIESIIASCKQTGADALRVQVSDAPSRLKASELLTSLVEKKDKTVELLEPFRKVLYESYEYAAGKKKAALDPIEAGVKHVKARCLAWDGEQQRLKDQRDRLAREAAAEEARRLQEAERIRLTLAEAQDALDEGDEAKAESLFDKPIDVPLPYVAPVYTPSVAPTIEGQSTSSKWKVDEGAIESEEAYLESVMTLLRAVKDDKYDMRSAAMHLKWDLPSLNKLAGALRGAFHVPGLAAAPVGSISVRRKK